MAVGGLSVFCALAAFVACSMNGIAARPSATPSSQGVTQHVWQLTLKLTGGFTGMDRQLELASTGELKVTDRRRETEVSTKASATELAQIASMVANLKSLDAARESTCRDCVQYGLSIRLNGRSLLLNLDDLSLVGNPAEPLTNALTRVLSRELTRERNTRGK